MKKVYLIATVIALITGLTTFFVFKSVSGKKKVKDVDVDVVIAVVDIKENTTITEDMVQVIKMPQSQTKTGYLTNVSHAVGKLTIFSIPKDGQVLSSQLIALGDPNVDTTNNNKKLSLILEPGDYALSVPVTLIDAVSYFPRENDYVDVYLVEKVTPSEVGQTDVNGSTYEEEDTKVKLIVEQVRILKVSNLQQEATAAATGAPITAFTEVTLRLNKTQVQKVAAAMGHGTIKLALSAFGESDIETSTTQAVTTPPSSEAASENE